MSESMSQLIGRKRKRNQIDDDTKDERSPNAGDMIMDSNDGDVNAGTEVEFSKEYLQIYYDKLFPYQAFFDWLSYFNDISGNKIDDDNDGSNAVSKYWENREFSFTLKDDVYIRYKSYKSVDEFRGDLLKNIPFKIDIGAIYNHKPKLKKEYKMFSGSNVEFIAEEKEFVIDIDISDYDDVRNCCNEANICNKCWMLMSCAIKVLNEILINDFDFKHIFYVFSGRRGIHCWICDDIIKKFNVSQRTDIINYIAKYIGNQNNNIKVDLTKNNKSYMIHEFYRRNYEICREYFIKCSIKEQNIFNNNNDINYLTDMIRDNGLKNEIKSMLLHNIGNNDYMSQWNTFNKTWDDYIGKYIKDFTQKKLLKLNKMEIIFAYTYPRLDTEVSRHVNHLLKSPFCIHPKTGKICTIINPNNCDTFNPNNQPTLSKLINEINNIDTDIKISYKNTSMNAVVELFQETFLNALKIDKQ